MTNRRLMLLFALVLLILFSTVAGILLVDLAENEEAAGKLYTYPVSVGEKTYMTGVRSNCSSKPEVSYSGLLKSVSVDFRGGRETVFFNITIPADLIWGELSVYQQGYKQSDNYYTISNNGTHHSVRMTFNHIALVQQISIIGTEGVPSSSTSP